MKLLLSLFGSQSAVIANWLNYTLIMAIDLINNHLTINLIIYTYVYAYKGFYANLLNRLVYLDPARSILYD
jgi:hypothetical protein